MSSLHKSELQKLLSSTYPEISEQYKLEFKNCFGAVAGYVDDNIFCSHGKFGFALKLPPENIKHLIAEKAKPLQYFPNGHIKKEYVVLPETTMKNKKRLKELLLTSINFTVG